MSVSSPSFPYKSSVPPPPSTVSFPGPPINTSFPLPPCRSSLPPPPRIQSTPPAPLMVSPAEVPMINSALLLGTSPRARITIRVRAREAHSVGLSALALTVVVKEPIFVEGTVFAADKAKMTLMATSTTKLADIQKDSFVAFIKTFHVAGARDIQRYFLRQGNRLHLPEQHAGWPW